jgi:hypothetical protein
MRRPWSEASLRHSDGCSNQQAFVRSPRAFVGSSAFAVIGVGRVLRQQCSGLLTVAALSDSTAASCISELTLSTY